jgi:hypothetical protein
VFAFAPPPPLRFITGDEGTDSGLIGAILSIQKQ